MPLPRVAMYLAVALSSSAKGLVAAARTVTQRRAAAPRVAARPATAGPPMERTLVCMVE